MIHAGEVVAPAGAGLLASAGYASVKVHAAPRVGIISLGTELVAPSKVPARGQIRDSNSSALMAEALDAGAEPVFYLSLIHIWPHGPDLHVRCPRLHR